MNGFYCVFLLFIIYLQVKCEDKIVKSKNPLPYFRRQVEEIIEDSTIESTISGDLHSDIVSFLIKNVKKIYNYIDDIDQQEITTPLTTEAVTSNDFIDTLASEIKVELSSENNNTLTNNTTLYFTKDIALHTRTKKMSVENFTNTKPMSYLDEQILYTNSALSLVSNKDLVDIETSTTAYELTEREELMHLSKNLIFFETDRRERDNINYFAHNASYYPSGNDISLRSCIFCDNIALENCNDPRNRL